MTMKPPKISRRTLLPLQSLLPIYFAARLRAQQAEEDTPRFSVNASLVRLLVSARDQRTGEIIADLTKDAFTVFDNDKQQRIAVFEHNTSVPLSIAILMDVSASTRRNLTYKSDSVLSFLKALKANGNPGDAIALYSFNWQVQLESGFSRNEERLTRALRQLHSGGGTSLYDAIYLVSSDIANRDGRHVMILVTDGGDTASFKRYGDAARAALEVDAIVYAIVVVPIAVDAGRNLGGEHTLQSLAEDSGGKAFYPAGAEQLRRVFTDILTELRTQYLLGFYSTAPAVPHSRYHRVKVETARKDLRLSVRSGYYEQP